jgi:hypothetical protein
MARGKTAVPVSGIKANPPLAVARGGTSSPAADATGRVTSASRFVEPGEVNPFGGASEADLKAIVQDSFGSDSDLDATEDDISIWSLARVVTARMRHTDWVNDPKGIAIFVITDRPRELGEALAGELEPIIDNGSHRLTGRLWVAGPALASAYRLALAAQNTGDAFKEVAARLGDKPTLVFDPNATDLEIRYYPQGVAQPDVVQKYPMPGLTFSLESLDRTLSTFHAENLVSPDATKSENSPWKVSGNYVPRASTEGFLQGWLKSILSVALGRCKVDFEIPGTEGRCDLVISSRHLTQENTWIVHATLELKVLRSVDSGSHPIAATVRERAIEDGYLQALAYRNERQAQLGMLCCYDMRKPAHCNGDMCLQAVKDRASQDGIELRCYRLYGSSADLRKDKYGAKATAG